METMLNSTRHKLNIKRGYEGQHDLSLSSTWQICSHEQRKKQLDWLATNTDDITYQSHSLFACLREQIRQVENRLYMVC